MKVAVQAGTENAGDVWSLSTNRPDIGSDDIVWVFYLSANMVADIKRAALATFAHIEGNRVRLLPAQFASRSLGGTSSLRRSPFGPMIGHRNSHSGQ
jgi:hypothetical protein